MTPESICRNYDGSMVVRRWAATWLDFLLFAAVLAALLSIAGIVAGVLAAIIALAFWVVCLTAAPAGRTHP